MRPSFGPKVCQANYAAIVNTITPNTIWRSAKPMKIEHFASCWRASRRKMLVLSPKGVTAWKPIRRKFEN